MRNVQNFIVKGKQIFIGLEDSKRMWKLCVRCEGMIVHETSMPAEYDNLWSYLGGRYPECTIQVMYEAGFSGFWLHDLLEADGIDCLVTPAHKVTQEKVNTVKTDRVDARRLARNLENGDYTSCHVLDRERREDRQISRTLNQIQRDIVRTKNRIRRFLDFHGLNGQLPAGAWTETAYEQLKVLQLPVSLQLNLDAYLQLLAELKRIRAALKSQQRAFYQKDRYQALVASKASCVGIGWLSAIRFTLEWGELSRFGSGKQFASFTGLTSREYSTGETIHRGHITRHGNGQVRGWLIQCAWRALSRDPVLSEKFNAVRNNSGSKKKARLGGWPWLGNWRYV